VVVERSVAGAHGGERALVDRLPAEVLVAGQVVEGHQGDRRDRHHRQDGQVDDRVLAAVGVGVGGGAGAQRCAAEGDADGECDDPGVRSFETETERLGEPVGLDDRHRVAEEAEQ